MRRLVTTGRVEVGLCIVPYLLQCMNSHTSSSPLLRHRSMIYIAKTGVRLSGTDFIKCQGNAEPVWFPLEVTKTIASFFRQAQSSQSCSGCSLTHFGRRSTMVFPNEKGQRRMRLLGLERLLLRGALIDVAWVITWRLSYSYVFAHFLEH